MVGSSQIFLSPDEKNPDNINTFRIPAGSPSIHEIFRMYPSLPRKPSLVFIKTDALARNFVKDVSRLGCPLIVSVADTHHLHRPIETILEYLSSEDFTLISAENDRHHLKWLSHYGFSNLCWLPNLALTPRFLPARNVSQKVISTCFIGSLGKFHPFRAAVIEFLKKNNVNLHSGPASQEDASAAYNIYNISLNISLNSDLNWRFFEVLAAGGFLLTDRLPTESGINELFLEGKHYEAFASEAELLNKLEFYTRHPEVSAKIALDGQRRYMAICQPKLLRKEMLKRLFLGKENSLFSYQPPVDHTLGSNLRPILRAYQSLQEIHRISARVRLLLVGPYQTQLLHSLSDYPRIIIYTVLSEYLGECSRQNKAFGLNETYAICADSVEDVRSIVSHDLCTVTVDYLIVSNNNLINSPVEFCNSLYEYSDRLDCLVKRQNDPFRARF